MAGKWREQKLGDVITLKRGYDLASNARRSGNVPIISSSGVSGFHDVAMVNGPGVVTGRYGTIGEVFYTSEKFWPLNTTLYVSDFKGSDPRFVSYYLKTLNFSAYSDKAAVPGINRNDLHEALVLWPGHGEQIAIAGVLSSLDAKIDLNRQMAATLEDMARALFTSWFVDFDPVHAKAEGRDTGLPADIAALFPGGFNDEGLPDGWRSGSLDDVAETNSENWKASSHPEEIEYVDLSNCKWGNIDGTTRYEWEDAPSRARRVARAGDTIFGTVRPGNGSYAFVSREGLTVSTGFAVLRPREAIYREMVYFAATNIDNIRWLEQLAAGHGGAYPAVNPDKVSATTVNIPCEKVAEAFASATADMIDRIESLKQESTELEQLRDTLLPKLLSGELRVADTETVIAAA